VQETSYIVLVWGFLKDKLYSFGLGISKGPKGKEHYPCREDDGLFVNSHGRRSRWPLAGHNGGASGEERHD
jgi:hypothetical protein